MQCVADIRQSSQSRISLFFLSKLVKVIYLFYPLLAIPLGCYRDTGRRAISTLEGRSRLLKGAYRRRRYAIEKCGAAAKRRGYSVFAIQHGGWCASARYAFRTYRKYGKSRKCRNGKGGPWANSVYILRGRKSLRLWYFFHNSYTLYPLC